MLKVIYFLGTNVATSGELAEIAALNARAVAPFDVVVRNSEGVNDYGTGPEAADYVMGTRPTAYADTEDFPALPESALVETGTVLPVTGGTVEITVTDGVVSAEFTATP